MKTRIAAGLLALAVLAVAFTAVASAASNHTTSGKLTKFSYTKSTAVGHLTLTKNKTKKTYKTTTDTDCGVHKGDSGDKIPCKSLGKPKYDGKNVRVSWTKNANGVRVAYLVAVDM